MAREPNQPGERRVRWELDRRISVIAVIAQTIAFVYWIGTSQASAEARLSAVEQKAAGIQEMMLQITRLETQLKGVDRTLDRIEGKLDKK